MKNYSWLSILFLATLMSCNAPSDKSQTNAEDEFSFAFLTDIHIEEGRSAIPGFQMAIDKVNQLKPDFVLTGGDQIKDALDQRFGFVDSLYRLYEDMSAGFDMPVYNTIGNHEVFGWHRKSEDLSEHPEFGKGMYEQYLGKRYYSFDHKGWHFIVLDAMQRSEGGHYFGKIDDEQLSWIDEELKKVSKETPLVISSHIPFVTSQTQLQKGALAATPAYLALENSREVLMKFWDYNLKLVLQGHLHYLEDIHVNNQVHFITGGAVSGRWWNNPPDNPMQEGFLILHMKGDDFSWEYVDYGWDVPNHEPGK